MKRLAFLIALVAGCSNKPCAVTSECGSGEACVAARCQALSCSEVYWATDPATGVCTPMSACADHAVVGDWQACSDPCANLGEHDCMRAATCQVTGKIEIPAGSGGGGGTFGSPGTFRVCQSVPQLIDPCKARDAATCGADSRCELGLVGSGCDCASGSTCNCPPTPPPSCQLKRCDELTGADECNARPDCSTTAPLPIPTPASGGTTQPKTAPAPISCFTLSGCIGSDEKTCAKNHACRPVYANGSFGWCANEDFTIYCTTKDDCDAGQRCNGSGICVVDGCVGENEAECNADLHCEPIYLLQCSPYANGGGGGFCGPDGVGGGSGGAPLPDEAPAPPTCGSCEPSFGGCQPASTGCDTGKSVLVRDPVILDDPFWSLPRVLGLVSAADANLVADGLFNQLGTTATVAGQTSAARPGAAQFIAGLPHRADGTLDASKLGFVPTSLSNRIDLADAGSCGEARITYALSVGVSDRRHRMTLIVELRQPDDGARCRTTAQTWVGLSTLGGAALQSALQTIYTPLLAPANLKQVRTNEFLVGPDMGTPQAWELREFHLAADARLHQVLLPLQIDPAAVAAAPDFLTWAQANSVGLARGTVTFPAQYQIPTGSEDGSRVTLSDGTVADLVNKSTCAGCHTTATNSAFAHVAERFQGSGRAEISQFLEGELQKRGAHLGLVAAGLVNPILDVRPLH
jgi:hypothetical protein